MNIRQQPLAGSSFTNWIGLLIENRGVDFQYIPRAIYISFMSFISIPNRIFENILFGEKIKNVRIDQPPIFIIGHWRSGTTYCHNVLSQDPNLGYVSSLQAWTPGIFLGSRPIAQFVLGSNLPKTRPMDNIRLSTDSPQEEEYALGNMSPYCFYHGWYFPRNMKEYFRKFVLFEDPYHEVQDKWKKVYLKILKQATLNMEGKRLAIKNPTNTARINLLLEMFPNAKFIHIYRNPCHVYASTKKMYQNLLRLFSLQHISSQEIEKNIISFYRQTMQKYLAEKEKIPESNLIEIKYEDFELDPIKYMKEIYEKFDIPNFVEAKPYFESYIQSQQKYQKNNYVLDEEILQKVNKNWGFALEEFNYKVSTLMEKPSI